MSRRLAPLLATGLVVAIAGCSGSARLHSAPAAPPAAETALLDAASVTPVRTVTASAVGQADGSPDLLTVSLGVQTQARSAQAALADNATKANALIAKLKADGVADKDIQTSQLQVSPQYAGGGGPTPPVITGYMVTNLVTAKLRKLDRAGTLIDDAVATAGNDARVNSLGYSIDDDSALLIAARADAVRQAQARAKAMAQAAGANLGAVRAITDTTAPQVQPMYAAGMPAAAGSGQAMSTPLQPGTQRLQVQVTVVYDLA